MSAPDLTATLLNCQNPDPTIRTAAEQRLAQAEATNMPEFALALATELSTEGKDWKARQLAGLTFKNLLVAKDDALQIDKHNKWKSIEASARATMKALLLQTLRSSDANVSRSSAQACAEVAAIELPFNQWPEFLSCMMENVTSNDHPDSVKIATLQCLGYTCERIATLEDIPDIVPETTDRMLTCIVNGIRPDRPDEIRYEAATALRNSLLFSRKNMENANERTMIMQTICEATQSPVARVRAAAYECIAQIAFQYYDKLVDYMQTLFQLTFNTIKTDEEAVALQAIEFWSTLCEEEMELLDEAADCAERNVPVESGRECVRYVAAALEHLGPLLTETLTKQHENAEVDEDTWNLSMAGATCLSLVANTVEDLVVPVVMPFVQTNIKSENWRFREAAIMAFSSILDGPSAEVIGPYVNQSIPVLLAALSDPHVMVRDTTAWCIGRICQLHVRSIPPETFPTLVNGLMSRGLSESPRVSAQACFALFHLASAFRGDTAAEATGTNALSQYLPTLLQTLLQVADRDDADENNLLFSAFEAVSALIQVSAKDVRPLMMELLPAMVDRLSKSLTMSVLTNDDRERKEGLQGLLCGLIQVICVKLDSKEDVQRHCDAIMTNALQVLQTKNATCHSEAFSLICVIADSLGSDFEKYVAALQPYLLMGLQEFEAFQVCTIAVGLVGDIARAIEGKIQPYCNELMQILLQALQNPALHRSVKPPVLSAFGDIASVIGAGFEPYLQVSLMMLFQASQTKAPDDDEELVEYVNSLREGILEAYTGIVQGMADGERVELLIPYIDGVMQFVQTLATDPTRDEEVLNKVVGLVGDLASLVGAPVKHHLNKPFIRVLLKDATESEDETLVNISVYASSSIAKVLG